MKRTVDRLFCNSYEFTMIMTKSASQNLPNVEKYDALLRLMAPENYLASDHLVSVLLHILWWLRVIQRTRASKGFFEFISPTICIDIYLE